MESNCGPYSGRVVPYVVGGSDGSKLRDLNSLKAVLRYKLPVLGSYIEFFQVGDVFF